MLFIIRTLIRWRKLIVIAGLATAIAMAGISFLLPKWWTATASVFPPETDSFMSSYVDVLASLQLPMLGPAAVGARHRQVDRGAGPPLGEQRVAGIEKDGADVCLDHEGGMSRGSIRRPRGADRAPCSS